MGLDSYFKVYADPVWDFGDNPPHLCGGLYSGDGSSGSFRGKVYAETIEDITGVSLYQESINHSTIVEMAEKLRSAATADPQDGELEDLARVFTKAAETNGCVLLGWW